jgi:hypothetical protein
MLAFEKALFGPRRSEQGELFIGDLVQTRFGPSVLLLLFLDDSMGEVAREADGTSRSSLQDGSGTGSRAPVFLSKNRMSARRSTAA